MRSGIPLSTIRKEVMIEARLSQQAGHATYNAEKLTQMINRTERMMALEEEWPDQQIEQQVTVDPDIQFADLPSDISFTEIEAAYVSYGDEWLPIGYGIGGRERTIYKDTQRSMPILKYEVKADRPDKFEVWPIGSGVQIVLFEGTRKIGTMVNEDDVCALDADVIVFRVAAQILGSDNQADAQLLLGMASTRTNQIMKKQGSTKRDPVKLGRQKRKQILRHGIDYIAPGSG